MNFNRLLHKPTVTTRLRLLRNFPTTQRNFNDYASSPQQRTTTTGNDNQHDVDWETGIRLNPFIRFQFAAEYATAISTNSIMPRHKTLYRRSCRLRDLVVTRAISKTQALHSLSAPGADLFNACEPNANSRDFPKNLPDSP